MRLLFSILFCCCAFFIIKNTLQDAPSLMPKSEQILPQRSNVDTPEQAEPFQYFTAQRSDENGYFDAAAWSQKMRTAYNLDKKSHNTAARGTNNLTAWQVEGPTNRPGRVNCLALYPGSSDTILAGFATGGIFRSTDGGVQWESVFDAAEWCAVGDITYAPSDPNIVYASTGDPQLTGYTINGVGVFKSTDGGKTWAYVGFQDGGVLSTLIVHPSDPNTLYVASMGNPFVRNTERGVYKSTDGGVTWTKQINISDQAGCIDLVMNPQNPDILYASFWDRIRNATSSIAWGPNAKIFKTTDGGSTWAHLTNGLPSGNNCRIGLAISQQNPDKVYAVYCDSTYHVGGLYKTTDGGQSWTSESISGATNAYVGFGWYFGKLRLNPYNDEDIYLPGIVLYRKEPNQNTFFVAAGAHADIHELIVAPNGKRYLGSDGGPYYHVPGQNAQWSLSQNLPTTQFYKLGINPNQPTWYYGGAQDNGTLGGEQGQNWSSFYSKDGFDCHFHPTDPDIYWMASQNGEINMTTDGGQTWFYGSRCLNSNDRCSWNTPYLLSPHNPQRLYGGTYRVYTAAGLSSLSWAPISPDLTDGNIYGNPFHVITCLHESIHEQNVVLAGTSDGNVWVRDPSSSWQPINLNLPDLWVTSVQESPITVGTYYVTYSGQRSNDNTSHIYRKSGLNWVNIAGDLPNLPVNDLLILPNHADSILLAATDIGVYFTRNSGQNWFRLGSEMPYVPVYELEYNIAQNEIAAATFGRSIWSFPKDSILTQKEPLDLFSISGFVGDSAQSKGLTGYDIQTYSSGTAFGADYTIDALLYGSDIRVRPTKNDDAVVGVNSFDMLLLQKHLLGTKGLNSPYKIIAADANKSGSITPSDIIELRKLILGIYPDTLPKVQSWRFVPSTYQFSNSANPFLDNFPEYLDFEDIGQDFENQDFVAIKVGDFDQSAYQLAKEQWANPRSETVIDLKANNQLGTENELIRIEISLESASLAALQGRLKFESAALDFISVRPIAKGISTEHFYYDAPKNQLNFVFENVEGVGESAILFELSCTTKKRVYLSDCMHIEGEQSIAFDSEGNAYPIALGFYEKQIEKEPDSFTFFPNPAKGQGMFMHCPKGIGQGAELRIFNLQGKLVFSKKIQENTPSIHVQMRDIGGQNGVYIWSLDGQTGKLVF